jgi:uncharacterized membrane protein
MAFCGNCGAPITQGTGFCGSCGKQVNPAPQPDVAAAAPAQPVSSGNVGWAPVSAQQAPPPAMPAPSAPRQDSISWSATPNQAAQTGGWSSVPAQAAIAAPNPGSNWSGAAVPPNVAVAPAMAATAGTGLTRNIAGALAYSLGIITGVLFLVLEPYRRDRFVRFHAFQSIFYFVFAVAFSIAWSIVVGILMNISGWVLVVSFPLRLIISLGMFGLWLYLMFQAYNEREFRIPILGVIASKQAQS